MILNHSFLETNLQSIPFIMRRPVLTRVLADGQRRPEGRAWLISGGAHRLLWSWVPGPGDTGV